MTQGAKQQTKQEDDIQVIEIPEPGTWVIDQSHSSVGFVARHLMVSKVRGQFGEFAGKIQIADPIEQSVVDVEIQAASIESKEAQRDAHLKSDDFLDVENHPTLRFVSTKIERTRGESGSMTGDLTIRGVTRPVTLNVDLLGTAQDPWGGTRAIFSASTKINREDFGLTWNMALEAGGVLVSKEVNIELEITAVKQ